METAMPAVTLSPRIQVVIFKEIRESLGIFSGKKIQVLTYQNRIELIPQQPMEEMKEVLRGLDTSVERDKDRL